MNGRLTTGSHAASGTWVVLLNSIDTPVTPPSMKLLESRKPFSPIPAAAMPATMNKRFRTSRSTLFIDSVLTGFAGSRKHQVRRASRRGPLSSASVRRAAFGRGPYEPHVLAQHSGGGLGGRHLP